MFRYLSVLLLFLLLLILFHHHQKYRHYHHLLFSILFLYDSLLHKNSLIYAKNGERRRKKWIKSIELIQNYFHILDKYFA